MIVNLLFWIITTLIIFPYGIMMTKLLRIDTKNTSFFLLAILGILPTIVIALIWGFYYKISIEAHTLLLVLAGWIYIHQRQSALEKLRDVKSWWLGLSLILKIAVISFGLITALQASMPTNIPDDGFYYLQTVKWANDVGIPFGVARFGFQYGQFSSWHILQATFNLSSFFGNQFNILNGWLMIMCVLWAIHDLGEGKKPIQLFKLFVVLVVSALQFFNTAPSPDLPVILLSILVFKIFLFDEASNANLRILVVLSIIALSIKLSSFYLVFFIIAFGYKLILKERRLILLGFFVGALLVGKNIVTTGSPFFPLDFYTPNWVDWKVDAKILKEGKTIIRNSPLIKNYAEFLRDFSVAQKIESWFNHEGYRGLMNKLWLFGILILGVVAIIGKSKNAFLVFVFSVIHFIILWVFAPNYRFALAIILLNYYLIFYFVVGLQFKNYTHVLLPLALFSSIIWLTPVIHPIQRLSKNQIVANTYPLRLEYFLLPSKPFVSDSYEKKLFNGEEVFVPPSYHYAWDGPLPCVMRNHYEKYAK